ncbi:amidase [Mitsuaria sp. WAJ17]|uniref:amidase family protein n=1 Tax=Mitsuaria sp. WAJ17 TaxID=2761452 RepID=UPI0016005858|nr:amidase family protein [Mitsuaria sp. WAJ17]MBB2484017.1 amidase [Mitsuaria sp. WAJ17]
MPPLHQLSATELIGHYATRALSPVEVIQALLARHETLAEALNAFCFMNKDSALQQARASEARWRAGKALSTLDGIPVSIKDNLGTDDMPTRFGSLAVSPERVQLPDSPAVRRLRDAGAVIFGKTTLPDFAHKITTDSPLSGVTRNPWNLAHTPGGSSGGAAAAVAAGLSPLALGTDGGGSIRIPAAFTGIYGFKPSFGRVPHHPRGAFALLSHVGPMARTVEDAAAMMNIISRPDPRDWYALPYDPADYRAALRTPLQRLRIALSPSLGLDRQADPEIVATLKHSARILESMGAHVELADPPAVLQCLQIHGVLWSAFAARLADSLGDAAHSLDPSLKALVEAGRQLPQHCVLDALARRGEAGREVNEFFTRFDLVLSPVHPSPPPALSENLQQNPPYPVYTPWCNQLGLPAASLYAGHTSEGLPIGLQLVGRQYDDSTVLKASYAFQQAVGHAGVAERPLRMQAGQRDATRSHRSLA